MKNKLKIAEPCHENWNEMTAIDKGKHCAVCAKQVIDFTQNSREEIVNYLEQTKGQTCGRFKCGQIDIYGTEAKSASKPSVSFFKAIAASVLAAFGIGSNTIIAQSGEHFEMGDVVAEPIEIITSNTHNIALLGTIKSHGSIVENAKVSVYSNGKLLKSIRTKTDGRYSFQWDKGKLPSNLVTIKVFASGFENKLIENIELKKGENTIDISMENKHMLMGKVMVEPEYKKGNVSIIKE